MTNCKRLTIFEGPDGGGKTTTAKQYAEATGARYVHFPALSEVTWGLARMYVEAMLPALLGYQDVVFDRCWLSEVPYGKAFRNGLDRLGNPARRMLERLAMKCGAVVVMCQPPLKACMESFNRRRHAEMLQHEQQLAQVYMSYLEEPTALPCRLYDYTGELSDASKATIIDSLDRMPLHRTGVLSAGNLSAKVLLVGEKFANHKDQDPFYQWPFASFSSLGCSRWLTEKLDEAGISENQLCWVNADQLDSFVPHTYPYHVVALGGSASVLLDDVGITEHTRFDHPSAHLRFHRNAEYPLISFLKEVLQ